MLMDDEEADQLNEEENIEDEGREERTMQEDDDIEAEADERKRKVLAFQYRPSLSCSRSCSSNLASSWKKWKSSLRRARLLYLERAHRSFPNGSWYLSAPLKISFSHYLTPEFTPD